MEKIQLKPVFYCLRATPFGPVAALWSVDGREPRICRILISRPGVLAPHALGEFHPDAVASSCPEIDALAGQIEAFLNGEDILFPLAAVRLDLCSPFQRQVLRADYAIPRGRVSTYGLIAKHLGTPNGARAVGRALATNPFPIVIPCHRVINSNGSLGGYGGGWKMKRALLGMEHIAFRDGIRVAVRDLFYGDQVRARSSGRAK